MHEGTEAPASNPLNDRKLHNFFIIFFFCVCELDSLCTSGLSINYTISMVTSSKPPQGHLEVLFFTYQIAATIREIWSWVWIRLHPGHFVLTLLVAIYSFHLECRPILHFGYRDKFILTAVLLFSTSDPIFLSLSQSLIHRNLKKIFKTPNYYTHYDATPNFSEDLS